MTIHPHQPSVQPIADHKSSRAAATTDDLPRALAASGVRAHALTSALTVITLTTYVIAFHLSRSSRLSNRRYLHEFRLSHAQRSDGWIETTWNNLSDPGTFAAAAAEQQEGGEPPPLAGAGVVVCLMGVRASPL